jgi:hypothetical protein
MTTNVTKFLLIGLMMILYGCKEQKTEKKETHQKTQFSSFEISYRGGWFGGLSFRVDSNMIFFSPPVYPQGGEDSVKYGIVPDSIIQSINMVIAKIQNDTSIKSGVNRCHDCPVMSLQSVIHTDTIQVFQSEEISKPIIDLLNQLEIFIDSSAHKSLNALLILETAKRISSPPPPKISN